MAANWWQGWNPYATANPYQYRPPTYSGYTPPNIDPYAAPNVPVFNMPTGFEQWMAPHKWPDINNLGEEDMNQWASYWQNYWLPKTQLAMQQNQWGQEFGEGTRRWQDQFDWTRNTDQFAMDLSKRQQDWQEAWLPKQQENQIAWNREEQQKALQGQAEQAALATWQRKFRPNTRYL